MVILEILEIKLKGLLEVFHWCHSIHQTVEFNIYIVLIVIIVMVRNNHTGDVSIVYHNMAKNTDELI